MTIFNPTTNVQKNPKPDMNVPIINYSFSREWFNLIGGHGGGLPCLCKREAVHRSLQPSSYYAIGHMALFQKHLGMAAVKDDLLG